MTLKLNILHWPLWQRTPMGWLQLRKNKSRLLVAIAGIGFADLLMFAQLGIQAALFESNTLLNASLKADIILRSAQYRDLSLANTFPRRRLFQIRDIPGVASADAFYVEPVVWKNPQTRRKTQVTMVGISTERSALTIPEVESNLTAIRQADTVLFDELSRGSYQEVIQATRQGNPVTTEIDRRTVQVVGLFPLGASFATDGTVITSQDTFLRFFPQRSPGQVTLGLIHVAPGADPKAVVAQLQAVLPPDTIAATKADYVAFEQAYWAETTPIGVVFGFGTIMAFAVGTVIVFQILATDVADHLPEYATFKAMGYRDRFLLATVLEEAVVLAILGFIPGLALALGQYALIRQVAALPIAMTGARLGFVFFLTLVMCSFSGYVATRKLQSADPADIF
ncbi:MAG: FtsX-like permease family protein [Oscillatoriales cyanobacterium SM2_2_1]|nr:FtsX-like permease family protein [Oscillatoriales cyanobacterium SM2_2_1]